MKKVLFVCLGNICRSPMAEYLFREILKKRNLNDKIQVDSAGTSGWHDGEHMHCGTAEILEGMGIHSHDFISSSVQKNCLESYDYILVMDDDNLAEMEKRFGKHPEKLFKITDLLSKDSPVYNNHVPDPWYTKNFIATRNLLSECCEILANKLQAEIQK